MDLKILKRMSVAFFVCVCIGFSVSVYITKRSNVEEISNTIVRFHIRANSNSEFDQDIKMAARKNFFDNFSLKENNTREKTLLYFSENKNNIEKEINSFLESQNVSYKCNVKVVREMFPIKKYNNFTLPSGVYDSIYIELGEGKGDNFFCVMYPSFCMIDGITHSVDMDFSQLNTILDGESVELISSTDEKTVIKFKIIEIFNKFF